MRRNEFYASTIDAAVEKADLELGLLRRRLLPGPG